MAGAMTPTEIVAAYEAGARVVKLFPMASLGLPYLREIKAPLNHIPLLATGGANLNNITDYFAAGAAAVGLGSALCRERHWMQGIMNRLQHVHMHLWKQPESKCKTQTTICIFGYI